MPVARKWPFLSEAPSGDSKNYIPEAPCRRLCHTTRPFEEGKDSLSSCLPMMSQLALMLLSFEPAGSLGTEAVWALYHLNPFYFVSASEIYECHSGSL